MLPLLLLAACGPTPDGGASGTGEPYVALADPQQGDPGFQSIQQIAFGPDGWLLVGDGVGERLVVLDTGDRTWDPANLFDAVPDVIGKLSDALGGSAGSGDVYIQDMDVNPASGRLYLAVERASTGEDALLSIDGSGRVTVHDLTDVTWSEAVVPETFGRMSLVADVAWVGDWIVGSFQESSWSRNYLAVASLPLEHGTTTAISSTTDYHVGHEQWETMAPIDRMVGFSWDGRDYIAGTYTCTPFVRYPIDELARGQEDLPGETPFDYQGGQYVEDVAILVDGEGTRQVITLLRGAGGNADRGTIGTRVSERWLLATDALNEEAMSLFDPDGEPLNTGDPERDHGTTEHITAMDGADAFAKRDDGSIVLLRGSDLETLVLFE